MNFLRNLCIFLLFLSFVYSVPYKKLSYKQVIEKLSEISAKQSGIMKLEYAEDVYSSLKWIKCVETEVSSSSRCLTPIIKLTDFSSPPEVINTRPQIFLMGSIHGNEIVGVHTLTYLIESVAKYQTTIFKDILKNCLIIIVPMINPQGFNLDKRVNIFRLF